MNFLGAPFIPRKGISVTDSGGIAAMVGNDDLDVGVVGVEIVDGGLDMESDVSLLIHKPSL